MRQFFRYLLLLLVIIFLAIFLIGPVYTVVVAGLDFKLLGEVFSNYIYVEGLQNSLCISIVTTLMVFVIALPPALLYDRYEFPGKSYCNLLMMLPMILPPFVGALGFQQILGHYGVINTLLLQCGLEKIDFLGGSGRFWSVCLIEALHLFPILYLNLVTALGNLDPQLHEAARNLGAPWSVRFRRITLPLMKPGVFAGGSIVLVWSFTELGTPLMFGYNRVTPVQIFNGLMELETNPVPYALVVVMLFFAAGMYLVGKVALGRNVANSTVKGNAGSSAEMLSGWRRFLPTGVFTLVALLATLPHLALILTAFSLRWYGTVLPKYYTLLNFGNALSNKIVIPSIVNSLRYSVLAMLSALVVGLLISLSCTRWKLRGGNIADLLAMLPLAVPGIVVAFGYLGMSVKYSWAVHWFNPVENPTWLLAVAYAVRRLPYVVRSITAGLEQTPEELENAARSCGANSWRVLRKITLPLILANVIVGALFAFSFSMLEVSDSLILAQKAKFYPITRAIYDLSQILGSGPYISCAFGVWAMLFLATTLAAAGAVLGRKIGSIFKL